MKTLKLIELGLILAILVVLVTGFSVAWNQSSAPTNYNWAGISCSANGMVIMTGASYHVSLISTDSGITWRTNPIFGYGTPPAAFSADGTRAVAILITNGMSVCISTNSGNTWMLTTAPTGGEWRGVASSADGVKLFACVYSGAIWRSTNGGATWQVCNASTRAWSALVCSADGTKVTASATSTYGIGQTYTSTNSGSSWSPNNGITGTSMACSADGRIWAMTGLGGTFISTNFGANWISNGITAYSYEQDCLSMSADGKRLIIAGNGTPIYTSIDSGTTWETNNAPLGWSGVASSADGNKLWAVGGSVKGIMSGQAMVTPQLNLKATDGGVAFSWGLPSTNFALQQNSDLSMTNWTTLTNTPVLNLTNLHQELSLPAPETAGFYRLITQ